jgi:hypothetical protein
MNHIVCAERERECGRACVRACIAISLYIYIIAWDSFQDIQRKVSKVTGTVALKLQRANKFQQQSLISGFMKSI